jgi:hypothetical protein
MLTGWIFSLILFEALKKAIQILPSNSFPAHAWFTSGTQIHSGLFGTEQAPIHGFRYYKVTVFEWMLPYKNRAYDHKCQRQYKPEQAAVADQQKISGQTRGVDKQLFNERDEARFDIIQAHVICRDAIPQVASLQPSMRCGVVGGPGRTKPEQDQ